MLLLLLLLLLLRLLLLLLFLLFGRCCLLSHSHGGSYQKEVLCHSDCSSVLSPREEDAARVGLPLSVFTLCLDLCY